jgi:soluble cytochrome b562
MRISKILPFISLLSLLAVHPAWSAPDLKGWMKTMSSQLKQLQKQLPDASLNADTIQLCDQLTESVQSAQKLLPRSITDLPEEQQADAAVEYRKLLDQVIVQVAATRKALVDGDNDAAQKIPADILTLKAQGHKKFK